jgi:hypothetical protein
LYQQLKQTQMTIESENLNESQKPQLNIGAAMPRCSTCKHWKQNTFYDYEVVVNYGFCSEIGSKITIQLKTGWDGGYVDSIETKGTFGCVFHNDA